MINWLISPIGRAVASVSGFLLAVLAIYGKGRSDASSKIRSKANEEAIRRTNSAISSGDSVSRDPSRVRETDGYRRD
jgi:hypothetical protein